MDVKGGTGTGDHKQDEEQDSRTLREAAMAFFNGLILLVPSCR